MSRSGTGSRVRDAYIARSCVPISSRASSPSRGGSGWKNPGAPNGPNPFGLLVWKDIEDPAWQRGDPKGPVAPMEDNGSVAGRIRTIPPGRALSPGFRGRRPPGRHHAGLALCALRALARRRGRPDVLVVCGLKPFSRQRLSAEKISDGDETRAAVPGETESDRLDEALKESFPASDPVAVGHSEHAGTPEGHGGTPEGHASGPAIEWFDDLALGMRFRSADRRVTAEEIKRFAAEFDPQPYHLDEEAAKATPLKGLAASGWHTAAIAMRLMTDARPFGPHPLLGIGVDELRWLPRCGRAT